MKPAPFRYERPSSVEDAVTLLAEYGSEARVLAGGQSLVPLLNMRLARPAVLIDVTRLRELDFIQADNGHLAIGAIVRDRDAELSAEVGRRCPMLAEALGHVGHVEIRNAGTIGGSLAHADPAAELPLVAVVLEAELVARGPHGQRTIPAAEFFVSYLTTALAENELLTEVRLPALPAESGWSFVELARRQGDFALVAVAAVLEVDADATCCGARLALGGVAERPLRAAAAERELVGQPLNAATFAAAARASAAALDPQSDAQVSGAYRRKIAAVLIERALEQAAARLPK